MKKLNYLFLLLLVIGFMSCKEDEVKPDAFASVPSGEIVPVAERDEALTGNATLTGGKVQETIKWWKHKVSNFDYSCEGLEDKEITHDDTYIAFKTDGTMYMRYGTSGDGYYMQDWSWADSNKDAIILDDYPDVKFSVRELNDDGVVYASKQGEAGCSAVTWEEFHSPIIEGGNGGSGATGDIVPINQRDNMLTGSFGQTKWWESLELYFDYNCEEFDDEEYSLDKEFFAFKSNGTYYYKSGPSGEVEESGTWEWTSINKNAIYFDGDTEVPFILKALNDNQFIFATEDPFMECEMIITQVFGNPTIE